MTLDEKLEMLRLMTEEAKEKLDDLSSYLQSNLENATEAVNGEWAIDGEIAYAASVISDLAEMEKAFP